MILKQNNGFSLLEVLIALVIIAVGLLGISAVQMRATQAEMESYQRAQALLLVDDMVSRIRANERFKHCYVLADFGFSHVGTDSGFDETGCNARTDTDLDDWEALLLGAGETLGGASVGAMIDGRGCVTYDDVNDTFTVTVAWQGLTETFTPVNLCGQGLYGNDARRRVVSTTFGIGGLI